MVFLDLSCINPIRHMSPRWGFKKNSDLLLLYTLRSSGARGLDVSPSYRHIAPLGQKIEDLTGGGTPPLRLPERFRTRPGNSFPRMRMKRNFPGGFP